MSAGWIKLHRAAIEHPCLQKLDALGVWCALLMRAARTPKRIILSGQTITLQHGQLALPVSSFAEAGGVTRKRMRSILGLFRANQMIEMGQAKGHAFTVITVCNYSEWQGLLGDEGQADGHPRAKLGPTKGQARAKLGPTEQEREKEEDSSLRSESHDEPVADAVKRVRKVRLGTRISADWSLTPENRQYARDRGFSDQRIDRMHEEFVNHWLGVSGQKGLKADWDATWRNRVLQVLEFMSGPTGGGRRPVAPPPTRSLNGRDKAREAERRRLAEDQARAEGLHPMTTEGMARVAEILREAA